MQICITQIDGVRYFSKFRKIPERDRIEVELTVVDRKVRVYNFDLTDVLFQQFEQHPEILHRKRVVESEFDRPTRRPRSPRKKPQVKTEPVAVAPIQTPVKSAPKRATLKSVVSKAAPIKPTPVKANAAKKAAVKASPVKPAAESKAELASPKRVRTPKASPIQAPVEKPKAAPVKPVRSRAKG